MRHAVALLLTLLTSALSAPVTLFTGLAGCFFWPPLLLLCLVTGDLCRRSPLSRVFYGMPHCGVPGIIALILVLNRGRKPPDFGIEGLVLFLLSSVSVWAVYRGFLRSIQW